MTAKIPTRSPTHRDVEPGKLASYGLEVEELADGAPIGPAALIELAAERGRPVSHYYAGATLAGEVELAVTTEVQLVLCAGNCQSYGALDCIDRAADLWERRRDRKLPGFDILTKTCLDRCDEAAACELRTPFGTAVLVRATPETVEAALVEALS